MLSTFEGGYPLSDRPLLVHHVARMCGLSKRMIRYAAGRGQLRSFRDPNVPKLWLFHRKDVEEFLQRRGEAMPAVKKNTQGSRQPARRGVPQGVGVSENYRSRPVFMRWARDGDHVEFELGAPFACVLVALIGAVAGGSVGPRVVQLVSRWLS